VLGVALIVAPTALLLNSMGDSVHRVIHEVQQDTLQIPPPKPGVAEWPVVGPKIHAYWQQAHDNLPALVKSLQPKIGELAKVALAMVASIGGGILAFVAAFIIAGIIMAFGEAGDRASRAIFARSLRLRTRRRVHRAVGGDDPRRSPGRDRHRLHPGHSGWPVSCWSPACRSPACWRSWCSCLASRRCRR
jgi:predicted PurR-regulated permease PerM